MLLLWQYMRLNNLSENHRGAFPSLANLQETELHGSVLKDRPRCLLMATLVQSRYLPLSSLRAKKQVSLDHCWTWLLPNGRCFEL